MRVGILTSGGDCQSLNATMRGLAKALYNGYENIEILGFIDGYKGLMYENYTIMKPSDFSDILTKGGTILGTSRQPFKMIKIKVNGFDKVEAMKSTYNKLKLDCLVVLGGNGSQKTANLLRESGLNIVALPKTIDNDLWGTDETFGFQSAVTVATDTIDCIHTTAASHGRVFIVEIMGHKVGWLTLYAGIAGGADIILIPEIPYDIDLVADSIKKIIKSGKKYSIIAVAEGAISNENYLLNKNNQKEKKEQSVNYQSKGYEIAALLQEKINCDIRVTVPGHIQRGGEPCPYDRVLATRIGAFGAKLILEQQYGYMVAVKNNIMKKIPLENIAGKLKKILVNSPEILDAKRIGICFGDKE